MAKPNTRSARHRAREYAVQGLYSWLIKDETDESTILAHLKEHPEYKKADEVWLETLLNGVVSQAVELRLQFSPYIDRYVHELSHVEHAILLVGTYELKHHIEVPYRVVLNECVELSKSFGGTDSFKFINSVLDKVASQLRTVEWAADNQQ